MGVRADVEQLIRMAGSDGTEESIYTLEGEAARRFALRALAAATEARAEAQRWIEWMADEARGAGASWQQIGDARGVSRQWAHKRFG